MCSDVLSKSSYVPDIQETQFSSEAERNQTSRTEILANIHNITKSTMAGISDIDCTKKTSGRSTRLIATHNKGCQEWLGEQAQGEGEDMMEMREVKESVEKGKRMCRSQDLEVYSVSGSRCTHYLTN